MFPALVLSLLALAAPRLGPELTFAPFRQAPPNNLEWVVASWTENGAAVAVVGRANMGVTQYVRARLRADGTADPASVVVLPIPVFVATRAGDGMLVISSGDNSEGLFASRLDADGVLLTRGTNLIESGQVRATPQAGCGQSRCLVSGSRATMVLDLDGNLLATVDGIARWVVAGDHGFLVKRCQSFTTNCRIEVLDDDAAVKSSVNLPVQDAVFDGTRYVAISTTESFKLNMWSVDAATGTWSAPTTVLNTQENITAGIAWNGSMYLLSMIVAVFPPVQPTQLPPPYLATLRVGHDFAALDAAPVKIRDDASTTFVPWRLTGVAGGFLIFPLDTDDRRQRANVLRNDGTFLPPPPAATPLFQGLGSQFIAAAAGSSEAVLGVWWEHDADRYSLRAARTSRGGTRIDSAALELSGDAVPLFVQAASDGSGFAVVRLESKSPSDRARTLVASFIDAAGGVRRTTLKTYPTADDSALSLTFAGGRYQIAWATSAAVDAFTLSPAGDVVAQYHFTALPPPATDSLLRRRVGFDGRRVIVLRTAGREPVVVQSIDVAGPDEERRTLMTPPAGESIYDVALAPDGAGGYVLLVVTLVDGGGPASRSIARISDRGELLTPPFGQSLGRGNALNPALTRIGPQWLASWDDVAAAPPYQLFRVFLPLDGTTLQPGTPLSLPANYPRPSLPVAGRPGEALLLFDDPVSTSALPVSRATVQLITLAGRVRVAGH